MLRGFQGRVCDEEQERRYYQGSSERKSLFYEAEYMTALPLLPINFPTPIATRAGSIHEHFFNPEIVQDPPNMTVLIWGRDLVCLPSSTPSLLLHL